MYVCIIRSLKYRFFIELTGGPESRNSAMLSLKIRFFFFFFSHLLIFSPFPFLRLISFLLQWIVSFFGKIKRNCPHPQILSMSLHTPPLNPDYAYTLTEGALWVGGGDQRYRNRAYFLTLLNFYFFLLYIKKILRNSRFEN